MSGRQLLGRQQPGYLPERSSFPASTACDMDRSGADRSAVVGVAHPGPDVFGLYHLPIGSIPDLKAWHMDDMDRDHDHRRSFWLPGPVAITTPIPSPGYKRIG